MSAFNKVQAAIRPEPKYGHTGGELLRSQQHIEALAGGDKQVLEAARMKEFARQACIIHGCYARVKDM